MGLAQHRQQPLHRLQRLLATNIAGDGHHLVRGQAMGLAQRQRVSSLLAVFYTNPCRPSDWLNEEREFGRIPMIGEYVAMSEDAWFKVELVVHTPFACEFDAEVYAVGVDHLEVVREACVS